MSMFVEATLYVTDASEKLDESLTAEHEPWSGQGFHRVPIESTGGHGPYGGAVYAACFNHVGHQDVIRFLSVQDWKGCEAVLVMTTEEQRPVAPDVWAVENIPLVIAHFPFGAPKPDAYR